MERIEERIAERTATRGRFVGPSLPDEYPGFVKLFEDSFASGDRSHTENGIRWLGTNGNPGYHPVISTDIAHTGAHAIKFLFRATVDQDSYSEQRFDLGRTFINLRLRWWQYFPDGTEGLGAKFISRDAPGADNNKFFRIWHRDYNDFELKVGSSYRPDYNAQVPEDSMMIGEIGRNNSGMGHQGNPQFDSTNYGGWIDDSIRGRWVKVETHWKADSGAGDMIHRVWIDDSIWLDGHDIAWFPTGGIGNSVRYGYLMGWANSGFTEETYSYIDDFAVFEAIS